jgi:hypothetical protein
MDTGRLHLASRALIAAGGGAMQITNLNKALFYFDLACLRDEGVTYTGVAYVALEHGPVVDQYRTALVEGLARTGFVEVTEATMFQYVSTTLRNVGVVPDLGSEARNARAAQIGALAGGRRAVELSELSHHNLGWRAAIRVREGAPISMPVAMQQIVDSDDWLVRDLDGEERIRVDAAHEFLQM